jgi:hypothetical protein
MDSLIDANHKRVDKMNGELDFPPNGMSIDLLRAVYRNPSIPLPVRIRAAVAALPHETPRLQVTAQVNEQSFAELLDKRLARIDAMNAKAKATNGEAKTIDHSHTNAHTSQVPITAEIRPPLARTNDRRFRRF